MRFTRVRGVTCTARGGLLGTIGLFSICRNGGLRTNGGDCTMGFILRSRNGALGSGRVSTVVGGLVAGLRAGLGTGLEWEKAYCRREANRDRDCVLCFNHVLTVTSCLTEFCQDISYTCCHFS